MFEPRLKNLRVYTAYILLGGNMDDRNANLQQAIEMIEENCGDIIAVSSIYETAAWGVTDQPSFLNQVIVLHTEIAPPELMKDLLRIESKMGRLRKEKMGPRTIDIDILLIDDLVLQTNDLVLPHPSLHLRRFALAPLAEVAAGKIHPVKNKTIAELLTDCPDTLGVSKIS